MTRWLGPALLVLTMTTALAATPSDVLGPIPLTPEGPWEGTGTPEIRRDLFEVLRLGPDGVEPYLEKLRSEVGRGDPDGARLDATYDHLVRLVENYHYRTDDESETAKGWLAAPGDSLARWVARATLPAPGTPRAGAPSPFGRPHRSPLVGAPGATPETRYAALAADLAGAVGARAETSRDPQPFVEGLKAARAANRPAAEVDALLTRALAIAPGYLSAGRAYLGAGYSLSKHHPVGDLSGRIRRLAEQAPELAARTVASLALVTYECAGYQGVAPDLTAAAALPRDLVKRGMRLLRPGRIRPRPAALAWLRLAALMDDQEVAAAVARRLALHQPQMPCREDVLYLPRLRWAQGRGPRPPDALPPLRHGPTLRNGALEDPLLLDRTPGESRPIEDSFLVTYVPGPLAVDAVIPPRPSDPVEAWFYDRRVAGYVAHGAHDPRFDARALDLLSRWSRVSHVGFTDRRLWLSIRDDARSLLAAGCTDPLIRHTSAYLSCVAGNEAERLASLSELLESALALARSPYDAATSFWALDERRWMGAQFNAPERPASIPGGDPARDRRGVMAALLERILADPAVPDFAAEQVAERAVDIGLAEGTDLAAFARAARATEAIALALEAAVLDASAHEAWLSKDTRDMSPHERTTVFSSLEAADDRLERALALSPDLFNAAIRSAQVGRSRFLSSDEILRRIERAKRLRPRSILTWEQYYLFFLGAPRRIDIPDRVDRVLDSVDAMLAEASSWDASAVLTLTAQAHLNLAHEDMWAVWRDEFASQREGATMKRYGRFKDKRRASQIRRAIAHTLANTDGTLRSKRDHGHAAQLLYMLGDEKEALRHFVAAGKDTPQDVPGAAWISGKLWYSLPENRKDPKGAGWGESEVGR